MMVRENAKKKRQTLEIQIQLSFELSVEPAEQTPVRDENEQEPVDMARTETERLDRQPAASHVLS